MSDLCLGAWRWITFVSTATLLVSGCTAGAPTTTAPPHTTAPETIEAAAATPGLQYGPAPVPLAAGATVPVFSGPYASQFDQLYRSSTSELQRTVLADGRITDAEMSALQDQYRACLVSAGISEVTFTPEGSMNVTPPTDWSEEQVHGVVYGCQPTTIGELDLLYNELRKSPANPDMVAVTVECLTRVGLAPAGYTREDWVRDSPDSYPFDTTDERFARCNVDPANAGR